MDQVSIDLGKGDEDELALMKERMWDLELFCSDLPIIEHEDVEIDHARTVSERLFAAQTGFDQLQLPEEPERFKGCFDLYHAIDEPILVGVTHRFRFEERGFCQEPMVIHDQNFGDGLFALVNFVPNV